MAALDGSVRACDRASDHSGHLRALYLEGDWTLVPTWTLIPGAKAPDRLANAAQHGSIDRWAVVGVGISGWVARVVRRSGRIAYCLRFVIAGFYGAVIGALGPSVTYHR